MQPRPQTRTPLQAYTRAVRTLNETRRDFVAALNLSDASLIDASSTQLARAHLRVRLAFGEL